MMKARRLILGATAALLLAAFPGVRRRFEPVGKELDDTRAAEFSRRQADMVDDQELYRAAGRTFVAVRRRDVPGALYQSLVCETKSHESKQ